MSADPTYGAKVHHNGPDELVVESGGKITAANSQVTLVAPASTGATNTSPYGFSQAQADAIVTWIRALDAQLKLLGIAV